MIADPQDLKSAADAAFRDGRLEEAASLYGEIIYLNPNNAAALCNHSAVVLKCGQPELALKSAEQALHLLSIQKTQLGDNEHSDSGSPRHFSLLAKAFHRKAQALLGMGNVVWAVRVYRQGLEVSNGFEEELVGALRITLDQLPPSWLAKYWGRLLEEAQAPNPLSSRDGRMLKIIPPERRLSPGQLQGVLEEALQELQGEARDLMCAAWARCQKPGKAEAAFFRAVAYLHSGNLQQAMRDIKVALVYGPQAPTAPLSSDRALMVRSNGAGAPAAAPAVHQVPCWPAALALQGRILEAMGDNVQAALSMCKALELDPEQEAHDAALQTLLRRIPEHCARVLQERGSSGLEAWLAAEREEKLPEFLRKRPKYYYYYEWMKKRIHQQYPQLPEPVMDKMLTMEANELDLVLQYPQATQQTVERLLDVYHEQGEAYLETYRIPLLSWEEVKALKGPDTVGLGLGSEAYGGMLEALGMGANENQKTLSAAPALPSSTADPPAQLISSSPGVNCLSAGTAGLLCGGAQKQSVAAGAAISGRENICAEGAGASCRTDVSASRGGVWEPALDNLQSHFIQLDDAGSQGSASVEDFSDLYELD